MRRSGPRFSHGSGQWWRRLDSNQRRLSQRIYSPSPLTTRALLRLRGALLRGRPPDVEDIREGYPPDRERLMAGGPFSVNRGSRRFCGIIVVSLPEGGYRSGMSDDRKTGTSKDSHYARLRRAHRRGDAPQEASAVPDGLVRLYGLHTVRAALDNPVRKVRRMLATRNALAR